MKSSLGFNLEKIPSTRNRGPGGILRQLSPPFSYIYRYLRARFLLTPYGKCSRGAESAFRVVGDGGGVDRWRCRLLLTGCGFGDGGGRPRLTSADEAVGFCFIFFQRFFHPNVVLPVREKRVRSVSLEPRTTRAREIVIGGFLFFFLSSV